MFLLVFTDSCNCICQCLFLFIQLIAKVKRAAYSKEHHALYSITQSSLEIALTQQVAEMTMRFNEFTQIESSTRVSKI